MASKKILNTIIKILLPLVGVFLVWYQLSKMSSLERDAMWEAIKTVNPIWIVLSILFGILSHFSRALRWKLLLEPLAYKPKLLSSFMAIMIGYFANTFVIRSGEVLRALSIKKTDNIPFEKAFGTIVAGRIADLLLLILIMSTAVVLQSTVLIEYFKQHANPIGLIVVLIGGISVGLLSLRLLKKSSNPFILKIRNFGLGLLDGIRSILHMKNNAAFIFHSFFIWIMYIAMFWIMTFAVEGTSQAPFGVILAAFVVGGFSMSATNGGTGLYPIAMAAIFSFFGYEEGATFGWLLWGTQTIFNIIVGGMCALILLFYKKD